jgi:[ribosomal protein S18]-alanine N-acetyltransferase
VAVDVRYRRRGIAEHLLREALRQAGVRTATLEVRRSNDAALGLYRKLGFDVRAVRREYYQNPIEDGLILWWNP